MRTCYVWESPRMLYNYNCLQMMVQPVTEVPESGRGLYVPQSDDHVLIVRLSVALTESSAALASLGPDKRNCLFANERRLMLSNTYSQRTCLMDCRLDHVLKSCRCTPYYFNQVPGEYSISYLQNISYTKRKVVKDNNIKNKWNDN